MHRGFEKLSPVFLRFDGAHARQHQLREARKVLARSGQACGDHMERASVSVGVLHHESRT